ncbi:MAG TPA: cytochrome c3 family protein [Candidatus Bathyarchaeia archaeon]|nr:cytochrome c3 family protein [Candidatus Bathyarchaeia archaeon]
MTIQPPATIDAGAQWRVDGGAYQDSGATVSGLSVGPHVVSFKTITGWTAPADQTVQIVDGQTTTATGTYTLIVSTGALTVTLQPAQAIAAGGQWRVGGGAYRDSGVTVSGLSVGPHVVSFKAVTGWTTPVDQTVQIVDGQTTTATGTYTLVVSTGALTVTIQPAQAVAAGGQWRVGGGAYRDSGVTVSGLSVGPHVVSFKAVTGWTAPVDQTVQIVDSQTTTATGTYTLIIVPTGALTVTLQPAEAITAGVQWRVDGGAYQDSGATVFGLSVGQHVVSFKAVTGWTAPADQTVQIADSQTTTATGTYIQTIPTGALTVTIQPAQAVAAGGQWRVDGGAYQNSGATVSGLSVGQHTVSFKALAAWNTPADQTVQITGEQTTTATGTYTQIVTTGALTVTILPAQAITAGAQWRVDGGTYQSSGATVSGLSVGPHVVSAKLVTGWIAPTDQTVQIAAGQTTDATVTYTQVAATGALTVTILPAQAIAAGAQWRVDAGTYRNSGVMLSGLSVGSHTVSFKPIVGWTAPSDQTIQIADAQTTTATGTYVQNPMTGALTITIQPPQAVAAGAQWRVDNGIWHASGDTVPTLAAGPHLVSFEATPAWIQPLSQEVSVLGNQTTTGTGTYTQQLDSSTMKVIAYNDLGMHCMNRDFSEFMILPPYNVVHAMVIARADDPNLVTDGISIRYEILSNTTSVDKTNFWDFAPDLFGVSLAPDVGLTGNSLSGDMVSQIAQGRPDWVVTGIPITPLLDDGTEDPYPLALITVSLGSTDVVQTQTVVPVSWEISCELCHNTPGISPATDILRAHDRLHLTDLEASKPVACGACHAQPELGFPGVAGRPSLSRAMHGAHASRMAQANLAVDCYACHPGIRTQCLRDIHFAAGLVCTDCHGTMSDVADPARVPWSTEPRCGNCHPRSPQPGDFQLEQPDTLYRNSQGHHGVFCYACHGSPHAITPTVVKADNIQAIALQGHAGMIDTCTVCHTEPPDEAFPHNNSGDD